MAPDPRQVTAAITSRASATESMSAYPSCLATADHLPPDPMRYERTMTFPAPSATRTPHPGVGATDLLHTSFVPAGVPGDIEPSGISMTNSSGRSNFCATTSPHEIDSGVLCIVAAPISQFWAGTCATSPVWSGSSDITDTPKKSATHWSLSLPMRPVFVHPETACLETPQWSASFARTPVSAPMRAVILAATCCDVVLMARSVPSGLRCGQCLR